MKKLTGTLLSVVVAASLANAVQFEAPKDTSTFKKVEVNIDFGLTFNYQGLTQNYTPTTGTALDLQSGFILPTADLDVRAKVMSGFNVYLKTMLSSHHHNDTYVQGGYATIDNLDFITPGFGSAFMDNATIKMGVYMPDIGDDHFSRTSNAQVFDNPFITNPAAELYLDAPFAEVLYRMPAINMFGLVGYTTGQVNPTDVTKSAGSAAPMFYGKVGYDKQLNESLRTRVTESLVYVNNTNKHNLFHGDKAGTVAADIFGVTNGFGSEWNPLPDFADLVVSMTNVFVKYNKTELSGMYQYANGATNTGVSLKFNHYTLSAVQRFGMNDRFYAAIRYENGKVKRSDDTTNDKLTQTELALGWFLSKNAMAKVEYIDQKRENFSSFIGNAKFSGYMVQAALRF
ncbi:MAG: hypothetical protein R3331_04370 [Sulfurospirillaceae bacterium]|nr:hypothetical protein [Sulfurospirillaceae bacterium]